ncbi:cupin domain-containing protein [Actinotalea sp. AC32]|nr:cupin domain-containing protein [Actinotalea sp. AC32]
MSTAPPVVALASLRPDGARTARFEGRDHGSGVSFFAVDADPGQGPPLHRHPYTETWVVIEGEAEVTLGDDVVRVRADEVAVVQANTWHRFVATGTGRLRMVCIHASDVMVQENRGDA